MDKHTIVGHDDWIEARKELLAEEKRFTMLRDELSRRRRELPWEAVDKEYVFEGSDETQTLLELFDGRSSWSSITSCSIRIGMKGARTARSGQTTSIRTWCT
jgi:predicted dithiol-disulfide oxidoreductase (DUF899 family)